MTKRETILKALHTGLMSLPVKVLREEPLPDKVPTVGLIVMRDGDPGEPEYTLSPIRYHYEHRVEIEVIVQSAKDRNGAFDALVEQIGTLIVADRTLGGLCDWVEAEAPEPAELPMEVVGILKAAVIPVVLTYATSDPLA